MNPERISFKSDRIRYLFDIPWTYFKYRVVQSFISKPFLPRVLVYYVTYYCNSQCIMCGIWKNPPSYTEGSELSVTDWDKILTDPLFQRIEYLNINGGEFTLRSDLPEVTQVAVNRLPHLKTVSMITNGIMTDQLVRQVKQIKHICAQKRIALAISVSVHGLAEVEDKIYGRQGTFEKQLRTIHALQEIAADKSIKLGISCVIMKDNAKYLQSIMQWCQTQKLTIRFSVVEKRPRFNNLDSGDLYEISDGDNAAVIELFSVLSRDRGIFKPYAFYYDYLARLQENNQERAFSCDYILGAVILGSYGELFYCPHDEALGNCRNQSAFDLYYDTGNLAHRKSSLMEQKCLHCPPKNLGYLSMQADIFKYLRFLMHRA